ncbi:MAG TPA: nucleotidyltransferase family protein [Longimicrobiales bacterium]|nr:nucleotidyltransferase family protein [Longimicrobiales bacterium]
MKPTTKAIILARGLGTRMRRVDPHAQVDPAQKSAADLGLKGMIPFGRPFFDYIISGLADAGCTDVCLVIGPEHETVRDYYGRIELSRVRVHFAVQERALGTADAVLAAESFAAGEHVLAVNSDNYYPVHTLRALRQLGRAGVAGFERSALVRLSNIDAERVAQYSVIEFDDSGLLIRVIEKPDARTLAALGPEVYVGMNSWSLPPQIYQACRSIVPSPRGELELQSAVQYARDQLGIPFHVLAFHDGVLDLSNRTDIAVVSQLLQGVEPRL